MNYQPPRKRLILGEHPLPRDESTIDVIVDYSRITRDATLTKHPASHGWEDVQGLNGIKRQIELETNSLHVLVRNLGSFLEHEPQQCMSVIDNNLHNVFWIAQMSLEDFERLRSKRYLRGWLDSWENTGCTEHPNWFSKIKILMFDIAVGLVVFVILLYCPFPVVSVRIRAIISGLLLPSFSYLQAHWQSVLDNLIAGILLLAIGDGLRRIGKALLSVIHGHFERLRSQ